MKSVLAVILAILVSFYSVPILGAETEPLEKGMFFPSLEACKQTHEAGDFRFYQPDPENLKTPPVLAKGLPGAGCALEDVREHKGGSPAWVILADNVPAVFNFDGTPVMDGRCHNKIHEFVWLPRLRGLPGRDGYTPVKGKDYFDGLPGRDGRDGRDYVPLPDTKIRTTGWCGIIRTNAGCNWAALGVAVVVGGGIAISKGGKKSTNTGNSGQTGGYH